MNCRDFEDILLEYTYGELNPESAARVAGHLTECPACRTEAEFLRSIRTHIKNLPEPEPSTMTINRILAEAREKSAPRKPLFGFRWVPWLAGACLLVLAGTVTIHQADLGLFGSTKMAREAPPAIGERGLPAPDTQAGPEKGIQPAIVNETLPPAAASPRPAAETPAPAPQRVARGLSLDLEPPSKPEASKNGPGRESMATPAVLTEEIGKAVKLTPGQAGPAPASEGLTDDPKKTAVFIAKKLTDGETALSSGQFDLATKLFEALIVEIPPGHQDRPKALLGLAQAYEGLGSSDVAIQAYRHLADESPDYREMALQQIGKLSSQ